MPSERAMRLISAWRAVEQNAFRGIPWDFALRWHEFGADARSSASRAAEHALDAHMHIVELEHLIARDGREAVVDTAGTHPELAVPCTVSYVAQVRASRVLEDGGRHTASRAHESLARLLMAGSHDTRVLYVVLGHALLSAAPNARVTQQLRDLSARVREYGVEWRTWPHGTSGKTRVYAGVFGCVCACVRAFVEAGTAPRADEMCAGHAVLSGADALLSRVLRHCFLEHLFHPEGWRAAARVLLVNARVCAPTHDEVARGAGACARWVFDVYSAPELIGSGLFREALDAVIAAIDASHASDARVRSIAVVTALTVALCTGAGMRIAYAREPACMSHWTDRGADTASPGGVVCTDGPPADAAMQVEFGRQPTRGVAGSGDDIQPACAVQRVPWASVSAEHAPLCDALRAVLTTAICSMPEWGAVEEACMAEIAQFASRVPQA